MTDLSPITFSKEAFIEELEALAKSSGQGSTSTSSRQLAERLDEADALRSLREEYSIPTLVDVGASTSSTGDKQTPSLYLCGNSLGPICKTSKKYVEEELDAWSRKAVLGHWDHPYGRPWTRCEERTTRLMADVVGAKPSEVVIMSSLSSNIHTMLATFYTKPDVNKRHKILYEARAFPSDQYVLASAVALAGLDPRTSLLAIEPREGETTLQTDDILAVLEREKDSAYMIMLGGIQYLSGQLFDMPKITKRAKELGLVVGWDLAHAFANVPLALHDWKVDFAVWCTYKYGSAGPGGIAGAFVHERWGSIGMRTCIGREAQKQPEAKSVEGLVRPAGWWGHVKSTRFTMPDSFEAMPGAGGFQLSNPPLFEMACLLGSLETLARAPHLLQGKGQGEGEDIGSESRGDAVEKNSGSIGFGQIMPALRQKSVRLTAYLEHLLLQPGFLPKGSNVSIVTPADPLQRGSQLSIRIPDAAQQAKQHQQEKQQQANGDHVPPPISASTLVARVHKRAERQHGLIADIRNPDMLRLAPLAQYSTFKDVFDAASALKEALEQEL